MLAMTMLEYIKHDSANCPSNKPSKRKDLCGRMASKMLLFQSYVCDFIWFYVVSHEPLLNCMLHYKHPLRNSQPNHLGGLSLVLSTSAWNDAKFNGQSNSYMLSAPPFIILDQAHREYQHPPSERL